MAASRTMTVRNPYATKRYGDRSGDGIGSSRIDRRLDVIEGAEGAVAVFRAQRAIAEARQLEQARERSYRIPRRGQARERLSHELHGRVPRLAPESRSGSGALES